MSQPGSEATSRSLKAVQDRVLGSEPLLRAVFDHSPDCILVMTLSADDGPVLEICNQAAARVMGIALDCVNGQPLNRAISPSVAAKLTPDLWQRVTAGEVLRFRDAELFGCGRPKWDVLLAPIVDGPDTAARIVVMAHETTKLKIAADLVRESAERYRLIADSVADLVVRLGRDLTCGFVSPASRDLLGCEPEEMIAVPLADFAHPDDRAAVASDLARLQASGCVEEFRFRAARQDGSHVWVEATGRRFSDSGGGVVAIRDISHRKQIEDELAAANRQLAVLASRDALTGVANRRRFDEMFDIEWRRAARDGTPLGLVMLDVDRFKAYNDTYGHQAGDDCLCAVARAVERAVMRPADFVARYGGEEFVVMLPNTDAAGTFRVADRIRQSVAALRREHRHSTEGIVTISAGTCAVLTAPPANPRDALQRADENLYAAKSAGRNRVCGVSTEASPERAL